jgi:predicted DNA binding protein
MGTIVDATVRSEQFALGDTFEAVPNAEFEPLRLLAPEADRVLPYLWASAPDGRALHEALEADGTTAGVEFLSRNAGRSLFRIRWQPSVRTIVRVLVEAEGTLVGANAEHGDWTFQLLFADHDAVTATYDACEALGVDLSIERVKSGTDALSPEGSGLSEKQLEALAVAFARGYYAVPRRMTLEGLAKEVGVSHQALSERLRRGHQVIVSDLLGNVVRPVEPVDRLVSSG